MIDDGVSSSSVVIYSLNLMCLPTGITSALFEMNETL